MFKKAERKLAKLKLAITGPSGSGKTFSALRLAKGMGGKVAVIDTENGSASLYSDQFEFDVLELTPPFTTEKYIKAVELAEKSGYTTLILDSITHAWAGEGGLLEQKEQLDARPGSNHYMNWGTITKKHEQFKSALLHSPLHIVATMRSKMDYAQTEENGKKKVSKLGLAPVQRDGLEYEFTVVFDVAMNHEAVASKDRTGLFVDRIFKVSEETGKTIADWLSSGKQPTQNPEVQPQPTPAPTPQAPFPKLVTSGYAQTEPMKPAPNPFEKPKESGLWCQVCKTQLKLAPSGKGYLCPNRNQKSAVPHSKVAIEAAEEFRNKQIVPVTAEGDVP